MAQVNCARCNSLFEEARHRWPSTICDPCFASTICDEPGCGNTVAMDPTIQHGLTKCRDHRLLACHACGKLDGSKELRSCPRCYRQQVPFCAGACRAGTICLAPRLKIPPVDLDAIAIAREERLSARSDLAITRDRLPLYYGDGVYGTTSRPLDAPIVSEGEARQHAEDIYVRVLKILVKGEDLNFTTDESTYAVTLLYTETGALGPHFRIIITFSQYNRTYTSTTLRAVAQICAAMIEADPEYSMEASRHRICRNGLWVGYDRAGSNEHHAEARALVFAGKNEMLIMSIMPTKEFCTTGATGGCQADVKAVLGDEPYVKNHTRLEELFK